MLSCTHSFSLILTASKTPNDCPSQLTYYSSTSPRNSSLLHYTTPVATNRTVDTLGCLHNHSNRPVWHPTDTTGKKIRHHSTKHRPRTTAPHGAWTDYVRTLHCHRQNRISHVICSVLHNLHTRPPTVCKTRSDLFHISTVEPVYNDIRLCDISRITLDFLSQ